MTSVRLHRDIYFSAAQGKGPAIYKIKVTKTFCQDWIIINHLYFIDLYLLIEMIWAMVAKMAKFMV